jgi:hypothetical protein
MKLEEVHILPTNNTPEILLDPAGLIKISGRAIDERKTKFTEQTMTWVDAYCNNPAVSTRVVIALEYLNSFNSVFLASVLRKLSQIGSEPAIFSVKWYIEEDDDDLIERGEYISSVFKIPVEFIKTNHIQKFY